MDTEIIRRHEREFFLVWKALDRLGQNCAPASRAGDEIARAAHTLLMLMRAADCIDPTAPLDGSGTRALPDGPVPRRGVRVGAGLAKWTGLCGMPSRQLAVAGWCA
jgi:hypothetical protein